MISQQIDKLRKKAQKLPDLPGVYLFLNKRKEILYIGKATSIKDRVKSYLAKDLIETRGLRLVKMLEEAKNIDYRQTDSVLEALILEADLIKKFQPIYNSREKDDKSFNCVVITDEPFPRILVVRDRDLHSKLKAPPANWRAGTSYNLQANFGPFTSGSELRDALKIIRKIFPYRDKCEPNQGRPCFNYQIGLCPGVCAGSVSEKEYGRTIRHLKLFFQGKKKALLTALVRDMKMYAKAEDFEQAEIIKRRIKALTHIQDISLLKRDVKNIGGERIESYDVAHMGGKSSVGVMVVIENGMKNSAEYKVFNLKATLPGDDVGGLKEILSRRLTHKEWPLPKFIVVDGGEPQQHVAEHILQSHNLQIPIVAVKKNERHKPEALIGDNTLLKKYEKEILLANAEAHRFAIGRHRRRSNKDFLGV